MGVWGSLPGKERNLSTWYSSHTPADWRFIYEVRFRPEDLWCYVGGVPTYEEHCRWMEGKDYWVARGVFGGVVGGDLRVGVHWQWRGKGFGSGMVMYLKGLFPEATSKIVRGNEVSLKMMRSCGYEVYAEDELLLYVRPQQKTP